MNVNFEYFGKTHSLFISENVYWNWTSLEKLDLSYNCYQFMVTLGAWILFRKENQL